MCKTDGYAVRTRVLSPQFLISRQSRSWHSLCPRRRLGSSYAPNQTTTMARTKAAKERYAATRAFAHPKKTIEARVTKKLKKPQPNQSHKLIPGKGLKL
jgi:hypothetical protein